MFTVILTSMRLARLLLLLIVVIMPTQVAATSWLDYWDINRQGEGGGGLFFAYDKWEHYELGDTMQLKYNIRPGRIDAKNLTLQVFSVRTSELSDEENNYYLYGRSQEFCTNAKEYPPQAKLLYEKNIGNVAGNTNATGRFSLNLTKENKFTTVENKYKYPDSFIFARVVDPEKTIWPFSDSELSFCVSGLLHPKIHEPKLYPDFVISDIQVEPVNARPNDRVIMSYTIKNIGGDFKTTEDDPLFICLDKRNPNVADPSFPNVIQGIGPGVKFVAVNTPEGFCDRITQINAGQSLRRQNAIVLNSQQLDQWVSQPTENDDFACGLNKIVWEVNSNFSHIEESTNNNDASYDLRLCGSGATGSTPTAPSTSSNSGTTTRQTTATPTSQSTDTSFNLPSGVRLIKSPIHTSVYMVKDGYRHPFPNLQVYNTWFPNFSKLENLSPGAVEEIPLGEPVQVKAGVGLLKFPYNPRVYEVKDGGKLVHIPNEAAAKAQYGDKWGEKVITLPEIFSLFYQF